MYNAVNQNFYSHGKILLKNFFGSWKFNQSHTDITEPAKSPHPSNSHFQELADIFKCFWKKNPFSMAVALLLLKQSSWVSFFLNGSPRLQKPMPAADFKPVSSIFDAVYFQTNVCIYTHFCQLSEGFTGEYLVLYPSWQKSSIWLMPCCGVQRGGFWSRSAMSNFPL